MKTRVIDDYSQSNLQQIVDTNNSLLANPDLAALKAGLLSQLVEDAKSANLGKIGQFLPKLDKAQLELLLGNKQLALDYLVGVFHLQIKKILMLYLVSGLSTIALLTLIAILTKYNELIYVLNPVLSTSIAIAGAVHTIHKWCSYIDKGCEHHELARCIQGRQAVEPDSSDSAKDAIADICDQLAKALEPKLVSLPSYQAGNLSYGESANFHLIHGMEHAIPHAYRPPTATEICPELLIRKSRLASTHKAIGQILKAQLGGNSGEDNLILISERISIP